MIPRSITRTRIDSTHPMTPQADKSISMHLDKEHVEVQESHTETI